MQRIDFGPLVIVEPCPVLLRVIYFLPDFSNLVNVFFWETVDIVPALPRVHRFLDYWKVNIEAVIKEVSVSHTNQGAPNWRHALTIHYF